MFEKYGVEYLSQNKEVALRQARAVNKITDIIHWKTQELVPCHGSYEVAYVNYLNDNKIDYQYQIVMPLSNKKTLRIDFYLPETDMYIEIKGWHRDDSLEKWNEFHILYPNSQILFKKDLKALGIKVK